MNDITALAQGKSLRKKLNRRMNDALGFRRTSGGKHNTISLSIDECRSVIAALDERLALVEALEAAEKRIAEHNFENRLLANADRDIKALRQRIADLESRTVTVKWPTPKDASQGWKIDPEFICKVQGEIGYDEEEGTPSMEVIEAVLLAAGIQVIEGEQNNG